MKIKVTRKRTLERRQLAVIYQLKRYKEHKRLGICVQCSRKPQPGLLLCRVCRERIRKQHMERQPLFCGECKKLIQPVDRNRNRLHRLCAEKRRARWYPPIHMSAVLAYQERHRRLGLCHNCPRKAFKGRLCRKHYRMERERKHRAAG